MIKHHLQEREAKILRTNEEKVLDLIWEPKTDNFKFHVSLNINGEQDCNKLEELEENIPAHLTRRVVLSQLAKVYDPLGLLVPVLLKRKILMRDMCNNSSDSSERWDEPVNQEVYQKWIEFFKELYQINMLRFKRCVKPHHAINQPVLIVFCDASKMGYGCCAYIRWQIGDGSFVAILLVAKSRIAPKKKITIPRLEMCGAVLAARLRKKIVEYMNVSFSAIYHITDSMIVCCQIQKESYGFQTFVATRVGEIQTKTDPQEWWWVKSSLNPADLASRGTSPCNISTGSMWQDGPDFLKHPVSSWPISKVAPTEEVPDVISSVMVADAKIFVPVQDRVIIPSRFSDYRKLLRTTALAMCSLQHKTFKGTCQAVGIGEIEEAELFLIKEAQSSMQTDWLSRFKRLGPSRERRGVIVVGTRMAEWLKDSWNQSLFVLLPLEEEFTHLYVKSVHDEDHVRDIDVTVAKIRRKFWVPKLRNCVKKIRNGCSTCWLKDKELEGQEMCR